MVSSDIAHRGATQRAVVLPDYLTYLPDDVHSPGKAEQTTGASTTVFHYELGPFQLLETAPFQSQSHLFSWCYIGPDQTQWAIQMSTQTLTDVLTLPEIGPLVPRWIQTDIHSRLAPYQTCHHLLMGSVSPLLGDRQVTFHARD